MLRSIGKFCPFRGSDCVKVVCNLWLGDNEIGYCAFAADILSRQVPLVKEELVKLQALRRMQKKDNPARATDIDVIEKQLKFGLEQVKCEIERVLNEPPSSLPSSADSTVTPKPASTQKGKK